MHLPTEIFGPVVVVHAPDELTKDQAQDFETFLLALDRQQVVLDIDQVESLDSAGLEALISCQEELQSRGGDLKIVVLPGVNRKILEITRLDQRLEITESVIDAVKCFQ